MFLQSRVGIAQLVLTVPATIPQHHLLLFFSDDVNFVFAVRTQSLVYVVNEHIFKIALQSALKTTRGEM